MTHPAANRRDFLKSSLGILGAGAAVPYFWTSQYTRAAESANDRLTVATIGTGGRGSADGNQAARLGNMVACCDVDQKRAEKFVSKHASCQIYGDYRKLLERKDVDAVVIGTPDHWHTAISIAAMKAGKDVYCEKPLTLTIAEGQMIGEVVKKTNRIFQVGTQQRSEFGQMFLKAVAMARSGRLGKKLTATCLIGAGPSGGPFQNVAPPPGLDWDFWLGQAPKVPYCPQRCHGTFRWWREYSGGKLTDWGAHHVDIAQWALGQENSGPVEIEGRGEFPSIPNGYNTATRFTITLSFADGNKIIVKDGPGNGIQLEGEKGRIFVSRGKLTGKPIEELAEADQAWLADEVRTLYKGRKPTSHMRNFFDAVKSRKQPVSDVFTHHRSITSCHLCNIAMLLKRKLRWDPAKEDFVADEEASKMRSRPQRAGYTIEV